MRRALRAIAALGLLTACSSGGSPAQSYRADAVTIVDASHLVIASGCATDTPKAQVAESATEVRLRVLYHPATASCAVAPTVKVALATPLGRRTIVDGADGSLLFVDHDYRCSIVVGPYRCDGIQTGQPATVAGS
jgi:uncharacterized lipoprotein YmbA